MNFGFLARFVVAMLILQFLKNVSEDGRTVKKGIAVLAVGTAVVAVVSALIFAGVLGYLGLGSIMRYAFGRYW